MPVHDRLRQAACARCNTPSDLPMPMAPAVRLGRLAIVDFDRCYSSAWQAEVGGSHMFDHVGNFLEWLIAPASHYLTLPATLWQNQSVEPSTIGVAVVSVVMALLVLAVSAWRRRRANEGSTLDMGACRASHDGSTAGQADVPAAPTPLSPLDATKPADATTLHGVKAFRLFVSSTFADFGEEREVLQRLVFPDLDAYCATKGYQFFPLDLRWGVQPRSPARPAYS
jgi:hypothetical protein